MGNILKGIKSVSFFVDINLKRWFIISKYKKDEYALYENIYQIKHNFTFLFLDFYLTYNIKYE